jgi:hypothetical protein
VSAPLFWTVPAESLRPGDHVAVRDDLSAVCRVNDRTVIDGNVVCNRRGSGIVMLFRRDEPAQRIVRWGEP